MQLYTIAFHLFTFDSEKNTFKSPIAMLRPLPLVFKGDATSLCHPAMLNSLFKETTVRLFLKQRGCVNAWIYLQFQNRRKKEKINCKIL